MNIEEIKCISEKSQLEKWPYPKICDALKDAGVETYEVTLIPYERVYQGGGKDWKEPSSIDLSSVQINPLFSGEKLKEVLHRHQKEKTSYATFLQKAATEAGVHHYRVDMAARTVTYYGSETKNSHTEFVPKTS